MEQLSSEQLSRRGAFKFLGAALAAAAALGASDAEAQWGPPPPGGPGWGHRPPPPGGPGWGRRPPPPGYWGGPRRRRWVCWWRPTPWGPRRECGWRW